MDIPSSSGAPTARMAVFVAMLVQDIVSLLSPMAAYVLQMTTTVNLVHGLDHGFGHPTQAPEPNYCPCRLRNFRNFGQSPCE